MRRACLALACAFVLAVGTVRAQTRDAALERAFIAAIQELEAGNAARAEAILREMLKFTDSARVKLELARALFLQAKYDEAKSFFQEVSMQSDTPWRVRDNIAVFVREIEERTGYLKFGVTLVSDSNPRSLAAQKEFAIGDLRVTPTEAPKKLHGLRYSVQGWKPAPELGVGGYLSASYFDYPAQDLDRLTVDAGIAKNLTASGRVRGKAGLEFGTFGGKSLYQFPYIGLDAVLAESDVYRLAGEAKVGKVLFPDFDYLEAWNYSGALSLRRALSQSIGATLRSGVEISRAAERPYSYYGWDVGPGLNALWSETAFVFGASLSLGTRKYADADPLFGKAREDDKTRLELTVGNKQWRWRNNHVALVASVEDNRSNIDFYSYRKTNLSVVVE
jgi:hypothetical protein